MNIKPIIAIAKEHLGPKDFPAGTVIEIAQKIDLGHYTSQLGYFDLRLSCGRILPMVKFYDDLDFNLKAIARAA